MTIPPLSKDKILIRGDSRTFEFRLRERQTDANVEPEPISLQGSSIIFTMKLVDQRGAVGLQNTAPSVAKTSDDTSEILILDQSVDETKGKANIILLSSDTRYLPPGVYAYDVQVTTLQGSVITAACGRILLRSKPTEAEDLTPP